MYGCDFKCMYDLSVDGSLGRCFNQGVVVRLVFSGDTAHSDSFIGPELPETEGEQSTQWFSVNCRYSDVSCRTDFEQMFFRGQSSLFSCNLGSSVSGFYLFVGVLVDLVLNQQVLVNGDPFE